MPGMIGSVSTGHRGRTGLHHSGSSGTYASAPRVAAFGITGDLEVSWLGSMDDWTPAADQALISRYVNSGNQRCWMLEIQTNGKPRFYWSPDGTSGAAGIVPATAAPTVSDGNILGVKVQFQASSGTVTFLTSADEGASYTPLSAVVAGASSIYSSASAGIEIGSFNGGASYSLAGRTIRAEVRNGIGGGTVVASPNFTDGPWVHHNDAQGNVWTVNGSPTWVAA